MKKTQPGSGSSSTVSNSPAQDVETYLANVPEPVRSTLEKIRDIIRSVAPAESTEALNYGIPSFRYKGALVGYGAFKAHCSFFPMSAALIDSMKDDLGAYSLSKGTIRFSVAKPLSPALIRKIVKARVAQNESKRMR